MSGVPLQAGDSAIKRTAGAVKMIGRQRSNKRLLETLRETEKKGFSFQPNLSNAIIMQMICRFFFLNVNLLHFKERVTKRKFEKRFEKNQHTT